MTSAEPKVVKELRDDLAEKFKHLRFALTEHRSDVELKRHFRRIENEYTTLVSRLHDLEDKVSTSALSKSQSDKLKRERGRVLDSLRKLKRDLDVYSSTNPGEIDVPQVKDIVSLASLVNSRTKHKHFSDSHRLKHFLGVRALQQTRQRSLLRKRAYEKVNKEQFMKALAGINSRRGSPGGSALEADRLQKYQDAVRKARLDLANSEMKVSQNTIKARKQTLRDLHAKLNSRKADLRQTYTERAQKQKFEQQFYDLLSSSKSLLPKRQFDALHRVMSPGRSLEATTRPSWTASTSTNDPPARQKVEGGRGPKWSPLNSGEALRYGRLNSEAGLLSRLADEVNEDLSQLERFTDEQLEDNTAAAQQFEEALRGLEAGIESLHELDTRGSQREHKQAEEQNSRKHMFEEEKVDADVKEKKGSTVAPAEHREKWDFLVSKEGTDNETNTTEDRRVLAWPRPTTPSQIPFVPTLERHDGEQSVAGQEEGTLDVESETSARRVRQLYEEVADVTVPGEDAIAQPVVPKQAQAIGKESSRPRWGLMRARREDGEHAPSPKLAEEATRSEEGGASDQNDRWSWTVDGDVEALPGENIGAIVNNMHIQAPLHTEEASEIGAEFADRATVFYTSKSVFICRVHRQDEHMDFLAMDKHRVGELKRGVPFTLRETSSVRYDKRYLLAMPNMQPGGDPVQPYREKKPSTFQYEKGLGLTYLCSPYVIYADGDMDSAALKKLYKVFKWPFPPFRSRSLPIDSPEWQSSEKSADLVLLFPVEIDRAEIDMSEVEKKRVWTVRPHDPNLLVPLSNHHPAEDFREHEQFLLDSKPSHVTAQPSVSARSDLEGRQEGKARLQSGEGASFHNSIIESNDRPENLQQRTMQEQTDHPGKVKDNIPPSPPKLHLLPDDAVVMEETEANQPVSEHQEDEVVDLEEGEANQPVPQHQEDELMEEGEANQPVPQHQEDELMEEGEANQPVPQHQEDELMEEGDLDAGPPIRTMQLPTAIFEQATSDREHFVIGQVDHLILFSGQLVAPTVMQLNKNQSPAEWLRNWPALEPLLQVRVDNDDHSRVLDRIWLEKNQAVLHYLFSSFREWEDEQKRYFNEHRQILSKNAIDVIENTVYLDKEFPMEALREVLASFASRISQLIDSVLDVDHHVALVKLESLERVLTGQLKQHENAWAKASDRLSSPLDVQERDDLLGQTKRSLLQRHTLYIRTYSDLIRKVQAAKSRVLGSMDVGAGESVREGGADHGILPGHPSPWRDEDLHQYRTALAERFLADASSELEQRLAHTKSYLPDLLSNRARYASNISFALPKPSLTASKSGQLLRTEFVQHFLDPEENRIGSDLLDDKLALLSTDRQSAPFFAQTAQDGFPAGDQETEGVIIVYPGLYHGHRQLDQGIRFDGSRYDRELMDESHPLSVHPAAIQSRVAAFPMPSVPKWQVDELAAVETGVSLVQIDDQGLPTGFEHLQRHMSGDLLQQLAKLSAILAKPELCMLHRERIRYDFSSVADEPGEIDSKVEEYAFKALLQSSHALQLYAAWLLSLNSDYLSPHGVFYYETVTHLTSAVLINGLQTGYIDLQLVSDLCTYAAAFPQDAMQALYGRDCLLHVAMAVNGRMQAQERQTLNTALLADCHIPALRSYLTHLATFNSVVRYETARSARTQRMRYLAELNILYSLAQAGYDLVQVKETDLGAVTLEESSKSERDEQLVEMSDLTEPEDPYRLEKGVTAKKKAFEGEGQPQSSSRLAVHADVFKSFETLVPSGWTVHRQRQQRSLAQQRREEEKEMKEARRAEDRAVLEEKRTRKDDERRQRQLEREEEKRQVEESQRHLLRVSHDTGKKVVQLFARLAQSFRKNSQVEELRLTLLSYGYEEFQRRYAESRGALRLEELNHNWLLRFFGMYVYHGRIIQRSLLLGMQENQQTERSNGLLELALLSCKPDEVRDSQRMIQDLFATLCATPKMFEDAYLDIFWRATNSVLDTSQQSLPGTFSAQELRQKVSGLRQNDIRDLISKHSKFAMAFRTGLTNAEWQTQQTGTTQTPVPQAQVEEDL